MASPRLDDKSDDVLELFIAVTQGDLECLKRLIAVGVNVNVVNVNGFTPLYMAAYNRHLHVVDTLLLAGANVNVATDDVIKLPLFAAGYNRDVEIVKSLLAAGAVFKENLYGEYLGLFIEVQQKMIDHNTKNFMNAVSNNNIIAMQSYYDKKCNINAKDELGNTALLGAVIRNHTEAVTFLLEKGVNTDCLLSTVQVPPHHHEKWSALAIATRNGNRDIILALLQHEKANRVAFKSTITLKSIVGYFNRNKNNIKTFADAVLFVVDKNLDDSLDILLSLDNYVAELSIGDLDKFYAKASKFRLFRDSVRNNRIKELICSEIKKKHAAQLEAAHTLGGPPDVRLNDARSLISMLYQAPVSLHIDSSPVLSAAVDETSLQPEATRGENEMTAGNAESEVTSERQPSPVDCWGYPILHPRREEVSVSSSTEPTDQDVYLEVKKYLDSRMQNVEQDKHLEQTKLVELNNLAFPALPCVELINAAVSQQGLFGSDKNVNPSEAILAALPDIPNHVPEEPLTIRKCCSTE